ncbi:cyclase family protein [Microbispora sp. H10836]|uniref:cyclase family protein n=1 Tax=Microbispora sp. H10836 TaxID=2729106 RepID=UPI0014763E69|nr:cyclase family protein [Microbispora sp. H10836]
MIPAYDELPRNERLGLPHAWGVLPADRGSLAFIEPDHRTAAAALVQRGESLSLNLPLDLLDPPLFGRDKLVHRIVEVGRNTYEDVLDGFNPQAGSQWDGLGHVRARDQGFFGGATDLEASADELGIQVWAATGIVGRGVLLDVERWARAVGRALDPMSGQEITADDLRACADHEGVRLGQGDIVCVRTGWVTAYRGLDDAGRKDPALGSAWAGLRADEATARLVWDTRLGAVCADNPALECAPGDPAVGSLHRRLIPMLGTAVAELLDLDTLAGRCAALGRWTFLFVAAPLPLPGGVSSPSNAVAVL